MTTRTAPLLFYTAIAVVVLALSGIGGYVYSHEPVRDTLLVEIAAPDPGSASTLSGVVQGIQDGSLRLAAPDGSTITVRLPADAPVEELLRLADGLAAGATVNVGVENTRFGQVLTGVVAIDAIEAAP